MKQLAYWIFLVKIHFIAILPFWILYRFSDVLSWLLYRFGLYRTTIVRQNLNHSFPEKSTHEIKTIEKKYFRNLTDIFFETIKTLHIRNNDFIKRCSITNPEVINAAFGENKTVFLAIGHCGNWEIISQYLSLVLDNKTIALYKKLSSPNFDRLMKHIRQNKGKLYLYESRVAYRLLAAEKEIKKAVIILGDQTPPGLESDYWTEFLHQETPFFMGLEKMTKSLNAAVVFLEINRTKRGHYQITCVPMPIDIYHSAEYEISALYARLLEKAIINEPDSWLWSHRRWKHKRTKVEA